MNGFSNIIGATAKNIGIGFLLLLLIVFFAGGDTKEEAEAKRLGFDSKWGMEAVHEKGWHTNAQYQADEGARAKRLGFTSISEMESAERVGASNKVEYNRYLEKEALNAEREEANDDLALAEEEPQPASEEIYDSPPSDGSGGFLSGFRRLLGDESVTKAVTITIATKALNPGVSTRRDYAAWEEAGGYSYDSSWRRYPFTATRVAYKNDVLSFLEIKMGTYASDFDGQKLPSFENVKQDLSKWCGSNWRTTAIAPNGREASSGKWKCTVEIPTNGSGLGIQIMQI